MMPAKKVVTDDSARTFPIQFHGGQFDKDQYSSYRHNLGSPNQHQHQQQHQQHQQQFQQHQHQHQGSNSIAVKHQGQYQTELTSVAMGAVREPVLLVINNTPIVIVALFYLIQYIIISNR
jgi:hypothetical protein